MAWCILVDFFGLEENWNLENLVFFPYFSVGEPDVRRLPGSVGGEYKSQDPTSGRLQSTEKRAPVTTYARSTESENFLLSLPPVTPTHSDREHCIQQSVRTKQRVG